MVHGRPSLMLGAGSRLTPLHHQFEGRPPRRLLHRRSRYPIYGASPAPAGGGSPAAGGRGGVLGTAASTSARQRCHPTRRASRVDLPLQGRWGDIVAPIVINSNLEFRSKNLVVRAGRRLTSKMAKHCGGHVHSVPPKKHLQ